MPAVLTLSACAFPCLSIIYPPQCRSPPVTTCSTRHACSAGWTSKWNAPPAAAASPPSDPPPSSPPCSLIPDSPLSLFTALPPMRLHSHHHPSATTLPPPPSGPLPLSIGNLSNHRPFTCALPPSTSHGEGA
ncbi:unnamed protein product [Closterium sp. NIES-54]